MGQLRIRAGVPHGYVDDAEKQPALDDGDHLGGPDRRHAAFPARQLAAARVGVPAGGRPLRRHAGSGLLLHGGPGRDPADAGRGRAAPGGAVRRPGVPLRRAGLRLAAARSARRRGWRPAGVNHGGRGRRDRNIPCPCVVVPGTVTPLG